MGWEESGGREPPTLDFPFFSQRPRTTTEPTTIYEIDRMAE